MRTLLETEYFFVAYDPQRDFILLRRRSKPYANLDDLARDHEAIFRALLPYSGKPGLIDMRAARGNNDPQWEAAIVPYARRITSFFSHRALLVQTAAGKLHLQRLSRERGDGPEPVFTDEQEALAFLTKRPR